MNSSNCRLVWVVCLALVGVLVFLYFSFRLPTAREIGLRYSTSAASWPTSPKCVNSPVKVGPAKEVGLTLEREVIISGGPNPIPDDVWASYTPTFPNMKNTDRYTLFARSCFNRSPGTPADCRGSECLKVIDLDGYSWVGLAKILAADCISSNGHFWQAWLCNPAQVPPGQLTIVVIEKCHEMVWAKGDKAFFLIGPQGEKAIMHATDNGQPTTNVPLPRGWSLVEQTLGEDLIVQPFGAQNECFYNVIRDSMGQAYHQIEYAGPYYP